MKKAVLTLALLLLASPLLLPAPRSQGRKKIAVMGSSLAAGWVTSFEHKYDMHNGWAYRLERLLTPRGYAFAQVSVPGDSTAETLARMDTDLGDSGAGYVIVSLSLGNEGLASQDPDEVCFRFEEGLRRILERCEPLGVRPVVGLCYGSNHFTPAHYPYVKEMNLVLHEWDVPTLNFLGAMDDGQGRFPEGCTYDLDHPDNRGHEEFFYAVPPSLFDALEAGKPSPQKSRAPGHATVEGPGKGAPFSYVPADVVHPFAVAFEFRTTSPGVLCTVLADDEQHRLELGDDGRLRYAAAGGALVQGQREVADGEWHHAVLSHRHLAGETLLFVDGELEGRSAERLEPVQFVLGGAADGGQAPDSADYREWMVYRSALNGDEARALFEGVLLRGSLEVYAPLRDTQPGAADGVLENRAQSTAQVLARPARSDEARAALEEKIAAAARARASEPAFAEKQPIDLDPVVLEAYVGRYRSQLGFLMDISLERGQLYLSREGEEGRTELYPQAESVFFVRFPLAEITLTFHMDGAEQAQRLVLEMGDRTDEAERVE